MRLWTLHPKYLDTRGLVALWREALLAQAVLGGKTRGYTRHPQLMRFQDSSSPLASVVAYLQAVHDEACRRAYSFDATKIGACGSVEPLTATQGQLDYEWAHLQTKLRQRAPAWLVGLEALAAPEPHPLFMIVTGPVADWEVMPASAPSAQARRRRTAAS